MRNSKIKSNAYIKQVKDYQAWNAVSLFHRNLGDLLWEKFLIDFINKEKKECEENIPFKGFFRSNKKIKPQPFQYLTASKYHYAIAIEAGLKGYIIKKFPEMLKFIQKDNQIILEKIGININKSHDLLSLAQQSKILKKENKLFKVESDYQSIECLLQHLLRSS